VPEVSVIRKAQVLSGMNIGVKGM